MIREVQEDMYNAIDGAVKRAAYRAMRMVMRKRPASRPHFTDSHSADTDRPTEGDHG